MVSRIEIEDWEDSSVGCVEIGPKILLLLSPKRNFITFLSVRDAGWLNDPRICSTSPPTIACSAVMILERPP